MKSKHKKWHSSIGKLGAQTAISEINVTPFVDVCLVLLIIFMVVTPMLQKGIPVVLPKTDNPDRTPDTKEQLQITVKADNTVYVGAEVIRKEQVAGSLKEIFEKTPDREIAVKGDKSVKYKEVLNVLRACREAGFQNVGLLAERIAGPGEG